VPTGAIATLPAEARAFEPLASLDGGADGLAVHRRVAAGASGWLAPRGHLLIETSEAQAEAMLEAFGAAGLKAWIAQDEELEATVVAGRKAE
jgi:release factor glutamine methyltransferase